MLNVLIVDDEPSNIRGLVHYIRWNELGYEPPTTCESGEEALAAIRKNAVDVLISDVAMPGMNGIELVEQAKSVCPQLQVLMISGYNEFEFVQDALHAGAQGYVLKPLKLEEVERRLETFRSTVEKTRLLAAESELLRQKVNESQRLVKERFLNDLLAGIVPSDNGGEAAFWSELVELPTSVRELRLFVFSLDHFLSLGKDAKERVLLGAAFRKTIDVVFTDMDSVVLAQTSHDETVALQLNPSGEEKLRIEKQLPFIQELMARQHGSTVTIGCSRTGGSWADIADFYKEIKFLMARTRLEEDGQIIRSSAERIHEFDDFRLREELIPEMIKLMEQGDAAGVGDAMSRLLGALEARQSFSYVQAFGMSLLSELIRTLKWTEEAGNETNMVMWRRMLDCVSAEQIIALLMEYVDRYMKVEAKEHANRQRHLICNVARFIEDKVQENWTVKQLSDRFNLNASYLSVLFKKEMGMTISDFVQETRIKLARRLLQDPNIKVYEVAERVGVQTSAYFTYLFKKTVGCTPQEYRNYHYKSEESLH